MLLLTNSSKQGLPAGYNPQRPRPSAALRILVIEDDEIVRELFGHYLRTKGHQTTVACSGREGLRLFRPGDFDLIVMDLGLPDMSGLDLSRIMRQTDEKVRIILCSGYALQQRQEELEEAGINGFLQKPIGMADLSRAIEKIVGPGGESRL